VLIQLENMCARIHATIPMLLLGGGMSGLKV
jgi:hypothetical protein